jgi:hydroxymethylpyrimidine/phosphomethylpyrimidine kinase
MEGRVLIVAGSDSGGGAGIQGDVKTVTTLGSFAATAITALTAQNTRGVFGVLPVDPAFVVRQIEVVLEDIGADCIKTGMLFSAPIIEACVRAFERRAAGIPLVVDPVMVATSGARLLEPDAEAILKLRLVPIASVLTPNAPEAEALTGLPVRDVDDLPRAADALLAMGAGAVLVKGGHLQGERVFDLLRTADGGERWFEGPRIESRSTHGTGCALASAIAAGLARGLRLEDAVARARTYVFEAIRRAPDLGMGSGPLNHAHPCEPTAN